MRSFQPRPQLPADPVVRQKLAAILALTTSWVQQRGRQRSEAAAPGAPAKHATAADPSLGAEGSYSDALALEGHESVQFFDRASRDCETAWHQARLLDASSASSLRDAQAVFADAPPEVLHGRLVDFIMELAGPVYGGNAKSSFSSKTVGHGRFTRSVLALFVLDALIQREARAQGAFSSESTARPTGRSTAEDGSCKEGSPSAEAVAILDAIRLRIRRWIATGSVAPIGSPLSIGSAIDPVSWCQRVADDPVRRADYSLRRIAYEVSLASKSAIDSKAGAKARLALCAPIAAPLALTTIAVKVPDAVLIAKEAFKKASAGPEHPEEADPDDRRDRRDRRMEDVGA